ncbi:hypothetical protein BHE74_00001364 [Ensete ventricosum]|nr:hypothetical protein BHE74_00001364 [Ensete ventricosum]
MTRYDGSLDHRYKSLPEGTVKDSHWGILFLPHFSNKVNQDSDFSIGGTRPSSHSLLGSYCLMSQEHPSNTLPEHPGEEVSAATSFFGMGGSTSHPLPPDMGMPMLTASRY